MPDPRYPNLEKKVGLISKEFAIKAEHVEQRGEHSVVFSDIKERDLARLGKTLDRMFEQPRFSHEVIDPTKARPLL
mgnify:CR=1 FL=1